MLFRTILLGVTGITLSLAAAATAAIQPPLPEEAGPAFEQLDENHGGMFDKAEFAERPKHFRGEAPKNRRMSSEGPRGRRADRDTGNRPHKDGQGMSRRLRAMITKIVKQELRKQRQGLDRGMRYPAREEASRPGKHQGNRKAGRRGLAEKGPRADRGAMREFGPRGQRGDHFSRPMGFDRQGRRGWQERPGPHGRGQGEPEFARPEGHRKGARHDQRMMKQGRRGQRADRGGRADRGEESRTRHGRHHADERGPRDRFLLRLDKDGDGVIRPDEFQVDPRQLKRMLFRLLDLNGDGAIDRMEAQRMMKHARGGPEGARRGRN